MKKFALAMLVLAVAASSSYGVVAYSWENDLNGWDVSAAAGTSFSTTGVTSGSYSLQVDLAFTATQWQLFQLKRGNGFADIASGTEVSVDITTNSTDLMLGMMFQGGDAGGWKALSMPYVNVSSPNGSMTTTTVTFDYSAMNLTEPFGWNELRLQFRKAAWEVPVPMNATVYIDNFRVVPEPTMMSLVGLGGLALLRRRK